MDINGKKILITGGTGFIGSHLAKRLEEGNEIWVTGRKKVADHTGNFVEADVRSEEFLEFLRKNKFDYIFHLAGNAMLDVSLNDPLLDFETNAAATLRILNVIRNLEQKPKFVFFSAGAVYGSCEDRILNEDKSLTLPVSNYGVSKLAGERYANVFFRQYGVPTAIIRIFSAYGPGLKRQVIYDFMDKLTKNPKKLEILGDGKNARDLVFITDIVENIIKIASGTKYSGDTYNICSGKLHTTKEIAVCVSRAMGFSPELIFTEKARIYDGYSWLGDTTKSGLLGCKTTLSLSAGVEKTVEWYRSAKP